MVSFSHVLSICFVKANRYSSLCWILPIILLHNLCVFILLNYTLNVYIRVDFTIKFDLSPQGKFFYINGDRKITEVSLWLTSTQKIKFAY